MKSNSSKLRLETFKTGRNKFEQFLFNYSEIFYVYAAVPAFIINFLGLIIGSLLFIHRNKYYSCDDENSQLFVFLFGQMLFYYSFTIIYANLLFEVVSFVSNLTTSFALFLIYFISNTGWIFWGIGTLNRTNCLNTVYGGTAAFSVGFNFLFDLLLIVSFIILLLQRRQSEKVTGPSQSPSEVRPLGDRQAEANGGWKIENLDSF